MPAINQVIPDHAEEIDAKLFDAIALETWLHYGRNGALDWHGFEPLLSGTGSQTRGFRAKSGAGLANDVREESKVSQTIVTVVSQ